MNGRGPPAPRLLTPTRGPNPRTPPHLLPPPQSGPHGYGYGAPGVPPPRPDAPPPMIASGSAQPQSRPPPPPVPQWQEAHLTTHSLPRFAPASPRPPPQHGYDFYSSDCSPHHQQTQSEQPFWLFSQSTGAWAPSSMAPLQQVEADEQQHPTVQVAPQQQPQWQPSVLQWPSPGQQYELLLPSVSGKRHFKDTEGVASKRTKVMKSIGFIPMVDYVAHHPLTKEFEFQAGSCKRPVGVGSINPSEIVDKTPIGGSIADGYVEELSIAHELGNSWGGDFQPHHMLVAEEGPLCVWINKEPTEEATDDNIYKDFLQLSNNLLVKYVDEKGRPPPYLADFINRIEKIREGSELEKAINRWVLRHHPFLLESVKWRVFIEDFYTFYKNEEVANNARNELITHLNEGICDRWHLEIVPLDAFLSLVYWHGKEGMIPDDFFVRDPADHRVEEDECSHYYPYTSNDGFLAVFMRTFFVHGSDNARAINNEVRFSMKELELIIAYYFEKFLPAFVGVIFKNDLDYKLLQESIERYTSRISSSWRAYDNSIQAELQDLQQQQQQQQL